jgi:predicted Co/Zn/Cd cation transporter (cation efflux family)
VAKAKNGTPAILFGGFFTLIAVTWMLLAWSLAVCVLIAGRSLADRRRRTFCLVVAAVEAMLCIPFGTVFGMFTIIVLLRPAVRDVFEDTHPRTTSARGATARPL